MRFQTVAVWGLCAGAALFSVACGGGEPEPADPITTLRVPVGLTRFTHQSFDAVELTADASQEGAASRAAFDVRAAAGSIVELGVLRGLTVPRKKWRQVLKEPPEPRSYAVRFWRDTWRGPRLLLEETVDLAVNEPATFRIDGDPLDASDQPARILCELEALDGGQKAPDTASDANAGGDAAEGAEEDDVPREHLACLAPAVFQRRQGRELNVLMLSFDTLRPDHLSGYGYARETSPNLDRFADEGVLFTQAISPAPWTTPAHYSLFTGLNPSAHQNVRSAAEPFQNDPTLARQLRDQGYYTLGITGGGSISARFGMANGFNAYREYSSYPNTTHPNRAWKHQNDTQRTFDDAEAWLEANTDTRFFLFLHHFEAHDPYEDGHFLGEADDDLLSRRKALYDGDIRHADSFFGRLIDKLRELDLLDSTIVIFLSDHGEEFHEHYVESDVIPPRTQDLVPEISYIDHAHSLYDELLRIPLVFYVPGLEPARRVLDNQVRLIDVMPTVLELLGIKPSGPMQGESLVQLMRTGERESDPPALAEATHWGPERKAIRKDGYKYIWIPNLKSKTKRTYKGLVQHELFDLTNDPGETKNLYSERPELAESMRHALFEELEASIELGERMRQQRPEVGETTEMEEDVRDALKALGYLD